MVFKLRDLTRQIYQLLKLCDIENVSRLVIDAQGVVESSQSTYIAQFFTLYRSKRVPGPSLAFYDDLFFESQIMFFIKNIKKSI